LALARVLEVTCLQLLLVTSRVTRGLADSASLRLLGSERFELAVQDLCFLQPLVLRPRPPLPLRLESLGILSRQTIRFFAGSCFALGILGFFPGGLFGEP